MNNKISVLLIIIARGCWGLYLIEKLRSPQATVVELPDSGKYAGSERVQVAIGKAADAAQTAKAGSEEEWKERCLALQRKKTEAERELAAAQGYLSGLEKQLNLVTRTGGEIQSLLNNGDEGAGMKGEAGLTTSELLKRQHEELEKSRGIALGFRKGLNSALASLSEADKRANLATAEREQAARELAKLQASLQSELGDKEAQVTKLRNQSALIRLESDLLFEPGTSELRWQGESLLDKIAALVAKYPFYNISLEGHTDDLRLRKTLAEKYPSNWELSAARAAAAARYLT